jgi:hypothetical protein
MGLNNWKWRDGEISVKEFYHLSSTAKQEYITGLEQLDTGTLSTGDNILLNLYSKKRTKQFLSLNPEEEDDYFTSTNKSI